MADYGGWTAKAAWKKDRGLYGAGPAIAYPQVPGATDMAANHQFPFMSEAMQSQRDRQPDESLVGSGSQLPPDIFKKMGSGSVNCAFRWRGFERQLLCAMGFENASLTNSSPALISTGAYRHVMEMDHSLVDAPWSSGDERAPGFNSNDRKVRRGQLGFFKGSEDWVYYSVFINKFVVTATPNEGVRINFEYIAYDRVLGSYNHGNWTLPAGPLTRVLFHQAAVRIGPRSGGEGALFDPLASKWELTVDRKMTAEDQDTSTGKQIVMPVESDSSMVTLKLERPRYTDRGIGDAVLLGLLDVDTEVAAKVVMTGPEIGSSGENHLWGFFMTSMKASPESYEPNVQGPGPIRNAITLQAFSRDPASTDIFAAANYGGVALLKASPLVVTCHNADNTNYLLET